MGFISLASVVAFAYTSLALSTGKWNGVESVTPALNVPHNIQLEWSQYSPYFPAAPYRSPPAGCQITQANIIQRHGARFPTSGATARIKAALGKIQAVEDYKDPRLNFLRTFTYDLGADDLVGYGAAQSFDAGQEAFARYSHLITEENIPFVRASSSDRVVQSAVNWTLGFDFASQHKYTPPVSVIISEAGNDTLDDAMCPSAGSSDPQTSAWLATYAPPITQRLNAHAPNANLTDTDTYNLISLCPFISVFKETASPFCSLFEEDTTAFPGFGYSGDLDKFYGTGYGQELGPVQGVGYINELIARLTNTPVRDNTQTNHTLDSSPKTFPLNRTLYADFSHDNQMIAIYAAMGLFRQPAPLDPTKPSPERTWKASALVPFSARMVVERLDCTIGGEAVRVLVNDAVQPLEFCGGESNDGVCSLDRFVQSQSFARGDGNGDWEKCFE
ncbi:phytase [Abortiporus biennis]|nr:phytase [Abortiporus biennis]